MSPLLFSTEPSNQLSFIESQRVYRTIFRTSSPISQNLSTQVIYWKGLLLIHSMAHGPRDWFSPIVSNSVILVFSTQITNNSYVDMSMQCPFRSIIWERPKTFFKDDDLIHANQPISIYSCSSISNLHLSFWETKRD